MEEIVAPVSMVVELELSKCTFAFLFLFWGWSDSFAT